MNFQKILVADQKKFPKIFRKFIKNTRGEDLF